VGCTALHVAALNGHADVVRILLETNNALINCQAYGGWTPLHLGVQGTCSFFVFVCL
jgi:ankyrin repeat protein